MGQPITPDASLPNVANLPGWILKSGQAPQRTGQWGLTEGDGSLQAYTNRLNQQAQAALSGLKTAAGTR